MKTTPTGVRFDIEKLNFIKTKEGLKTSQEVVTWLIDSYWWQNKLNTEHVSVALPVSPIVQEPPVFPVYDAYKLDLSAAGSIDAIKKIVKVAGKDSDLAEWQKKQIETLGIQLSQKLEF